MRKLGGQPKLAANWVMGDLSGALNKDNLDDRRRAASAPTRWRGLLARIVDNTISRQDRQGSVRGDVGRRARAPTRSSRRRACKQITDTSAIEQAIDEVMAKNPGQLAEYRSGKDKLFGFFVGQVMKATGGKANPAQLNELLKKKLAG